LRWDWTFNPEIFVIDMMLFEESGLSPDIIKAVKELGFEKLTPIQEKTIPHILNSNQDVIASAQTGTGKTAAFGLPIIEKLEDSSKHTQVLVLAPTRELAIQIAEEMTNYSKYLKKLNIVAVYGGASIVPQMDKLKNNPHVVIGTPGRTLDLIKRKKLSLSNLDYLVLDEADEMLSMGFTEDLDEILSHAPQEKQTLLFSATLPTQIKTLAKKYMQDPISISTGAVNKSADNVKNVYYKVQNKEKYEVLRRCIDLEKEFYGIIFCRTRRETGEIANQLINDGFKADALHGDLSQAQRDHVMDKFRRKVIHLLVATDVAARGIDVDDLTHVVHYQLPDDLEVFIHRSGRTGRAGKSGISISLINKKETSRIKMLENKLKQEFTSLPIPNANDVFTAKLLRVATRIKEATPDPKSNKLFLETFAHSFQDMSKEDILERLLALEVNSSLGSTSLISYKEEEEDKRGGESRRKRGENEDFTRLFVNIGKRQKINPGSLIQLFNSVSDGENFPIGKIEIEGGFSFIEVPHHIANKAIELLHNSKYKGLTLSIEASRSKMTKAKKEFTPKKESVKRTLLPSQPTRRKERKRRSYNS
jgi:ATP-dependent RNA helicase DeaD